MLGTRHVLEACRKHGVRQLIYTSSPSVVFDGKDMEGVDESAPYSQHFDTHYFRDEETPIPIKKFEAEAWTDIGIEFLRETQSDGRPFFLTIQMAAVSCSRRLCFSVFRICQICLWARWRELFCMPDTR